jgi:hypothetical protein
MSARAPFPDSLSMLKDHPDHHDAELVLRLYELRREPVMRAARDAIYTGFLPRSYADIKAVTMDRSHPLNAALRQTASYWEMVYSLARHGIVHADFLVENNGEGLILFAKVQPWLKELRADSSPSSYRNAEWVATECEEGKARFARMKAQVDKQRAAK